MCIVVVIQYILSTSQILVASTLFQFDLQPSSAVPLYRQMVEQVERAMAGGSLQAGDELPSVRVVAEIHAINPMTASKAYALLEQRGLVERRKGLGMYVKPIDALGDDRLKLLLPSINQTAVIAQQLGVSTEKAVSLFLNEMIRLDRQRKDLK